MKFFILSIFVISSCILHNKSLIICEKTAFSSLKIISFAVEGAGYNRAYEQAIYNYITHAFMSAGVIITPLDKEEIKSAFSNQAENPDHAEEAFVLHVGFLVSRPDLFTGKRANCTLIFTAEKAGKVLSSGQYLFSAEYGKADFFLQKKLSRAVRHFLDTR
ncbi:MAG: hypothetical protein A2096_06725 [Spirochaetes bacterium GWF1_41_5]|nr:MAG: hypothetical protein A2096_06725 [Spirochaetes bacterium GWF1_41_5]HBE02147.1 hypothetical protein [Spirochaetia bacterium]